MGCTRSLMQDPMTFLCIPLLPGDAQTTRLWEEERDLFAVSLPESLQSLWFQLSVISNVNNRWLSADARSVRIVLHACKFVWFEKYLKVYVMACQSVIPSSLCVANLFTDEMKRETGKRGCIEFVKWIQV